MRRARSIVKSDAVADLAAELNAHLFRNARCDGLGSYAPRLSAANLKLVSSPTSLV
jgi:hypothetical protein